MKRALASFCIALTVVLLAAGFASAGGSSNTPVTYTVRYVTYPYGSVAQIMTSCWAQIKDGSDNPLWSANPKVLKLGEGFSYESGTFTSTKPPAGVWVQCATTECGMVSKWKTFPGLQNNTVWFTAYAVPKSGGNFSCNLSLSTDNH
jgi:hypothetical protein